MTANAPQTRNILLFGATGRTGIEIVRAKEADSNSSSINLHAFVRNPNKLSTSEQETCASIQKGDATNVEDIRKAIEQTQCDTIIIAVGHTQMDKASNVIREQCALALVEALGDRKSEISVLVLSALGAGDSTLRMGYGMGTFVHFIIRHPLADQTKQENILKKAYEGHKDKLLILRPPQLLEGKPTGKVVTLDHDRLNNFKIDRKDLAEYMINQAYTQTEFGKELCITTA